MGDGVEFSLESTGSTQARAGPALTVQMFGPLTIRRNGDALTLPASRKVRGLFAYLLLSPRPVSRSQLCELLWEIPNDPRGELRWCLSKIRALIDEAHRLRVSARGDTVGIDLADCFVDAAAVTRAVQDIATLDLAGLRRLAGLLIGDFLEGLEIDHSPGFTAWLAAQRRRFRACHAALLEHLVTAAPDDEAFPYLEKWLELTPFDLRVHEKLLTALARSGRIREGEEHLAASLKLFESEGIDAAPIRAAWRRARAHADDAPRARAVVLDETMAPASAKDIILVAARRASIAVMPFADGVAGTVRGGIADALATDVITRLAKLRSLFVIAQGSVFALHERRIGPEDAGRMLNVDYIVGGSVRRQDKHLTVMVELTETRTARIVWAEAFDHRLDDAFLVLDAIGDRIVASVAGEIEANERNRAVLKPPNSLDAWEAHHRGLWHMYRFNKADNAQAYHFFDMAVRLDPTFSRAYAGLSFTHWQNAFQGWETRETEIDRAFEAAGRSLMADDRDPAAHWAMGRALWMRGHHDQSITELEHAIDLSPNFALGHYMLSLVHAQTGDALVALEASDRARQLSPFDPLLFGPLGARAMALVRLGRYEESAEWGIRAAARPNAHAHIHAIAALSLALAHRLDEAREHLAAIYKTAPQYRLDDFLVAMQFVPETAQRFREAARRLGMR